MYRSGTWRGFVSSSLCSFSLSLSFYLCSLFTERGDLTVPERLLQVSRESIHFYSLQCDLQNMCARPLLFLCHVSCSFCKFGDFPRSPIFYLHAFKKFGPYSKSTDSCFSLDISYNLSRLIKFKQL